MNLALQNSHVNQNLIFNESEARQHLGVLLEGLPAQSGVLLVVFVETNKGRTMARTKFVSTGVGGRGEAHRRAKAIDHAIAWVESQEATNIYVTTQAVGSKPAVGRGGAGDVTAISHVCCEVDWKADDPKRPSTPQQAWALVAAIGERVGAEPSFVIDSGHGYHCWWKLSQALALPPVGENGSGENGSGENGSGENGEGDGGRGALTDAQWSRIRRSAIVAGFTRAAMRVALDAGYKIDPVTSSVACLLRLAGTINEKPDRDPVLVELVTDLDGGGVNGGGVDRADVAELSDVLSGEIRRAVEEMAGVQVALGGKGLEIQYGVESGGSGGGEGQIVVPVKPLDPRLIDMLLEHCRKVNQTESGTDVAKVLRALKRVGPRVDPQREGGAGGGSGGRVLEEMGGGDQSARDYGIACAAFRMDMAAQTVASLVKYAREQVGDDKGKGGKDKYLVRTVLKARAEVLRVAEERRREKAEQGRAAMAMHYARKEREKAGGETDAERAFRLRIQNGDLSVKELTKKLQAKSTASRTIQKDKR